ncbi:glutamate-rich protein 3 [Canis aureus]
MSHPPPAGLLAAYNSLTDKHLTGYFNNTRIRRHLLRSGLITRSGRVLSEKEYRLNIMKRDHQKYIRECLAQAIFHKVLDMERYHQLEIKKKLEILARKERIQRFKGEPARWAIEDTMPVLSPHPPAGPKTNRGHGVVVDEGHSSPVTLTAPRPYTAPGNMQLPIRLKPLPSNPALGTVPKITPGTRSKTSLLENEAPFPIGGKKAAMKFKNSMDNAQGVNRSQLPNINNYMMPIPPPPPPPSGKITRENRLESWRRRRFRPTTAPNGLDPLFTRESRKIHKTPPHSNAAITMIYLGKNVHLSHDHPDFRDEIKVYQQHCGGENLCVYKGKLLEKETFQFISKRHHGFPFSLTFFLNGMQVNRLSSCCEYKHRKGSRLGGKRGYFGFVCVERSSPCYKCIIAMGLDKNTTSPKPRKEMSIEKREELKKGEGKLRKERGYMIPRRKEVEGNKTASVIFSAQEEKPTIRDVRTAVEEMELDGKPGQDVWEDAQENIFKYEYEEDFEVDEEKLDEKANEEGQADDQMNGISKSPSDDEKDHLDPEKESDTSLQKAADADDNVKDEGDGCSDNDLEEDKQDVKTVSSSSSRSHPCSSCSEDESALGDGEAHSENSPDKSARSSSSQELSENDEAGKSHLPTEDYLEVEIEDQEIITADVATKPLPIEEHLENVLEEEPEEGTPVIAEGLSEKSKEHVSKEEEEKDQSKLWEGSTAKVKDKKAGPHRVEKDVGQIAAGAVEPGCRCHYDTESGVSSTEEEKHSGKPEIDAGAAPDRTFGLEAGAPLHSSTGAAEAGAWDASPRGKEAAAKEEALAPHGDAHRDAHRDADGTATQEEEDTALRGGAGVGEAPRGAQKPPAAAGGQRAEGRASPRGPAPVAGAAGDPRPATVELGPGGEGAAGAPRGGAGGGEAPQEPALRPPELQTQEGEAEAGLAAREPRGAGTAGAEEPGAAGRAGAGRPAAPGASGGPASGTSAPQGAPRAAARPGPDLPGARGLDGEEQGSGEEARPGEEAPGSPRDTERDAEGRAPAGPPGGGAGRGEPGAASAGAPAGARPRDGGETPSEAGGARRGGRAELLPGEPEADPGQDPDPERAAVPGARAGAGQAPGPEGAGLSAGAPQGVSAGGPTAGGRLSGGALSGAPGQDAGRAAATVLGAGGPERGGSPRGGLQAGGRAAGLAAPETQAVADLKPAEGQAGAKEGASPPGAAGTDTWGGGRSAP